MASPTKSSEKRRYKRQSTNVQAVMAIGEKSSIQCVILDFCEQGLFLQLSNPSIVGLQKGKSTKIYFSAQTASTGKEFFQIDAQIARVADDGIGVVFDNLSESMFHALRQSTSVGSISVHSNNPKFFLTSSNLERFNQALKDVLNLNLPKFLAEFFVDVQDELQKPTSYAENFQDIAAQTTIASVLNMNKSALIAKYCRAITSEMEFTVNRNEKPSPLSMSTDNLSLVEKSAFEDTLSFSTVVRKVNSQFKNQLYQLELKLSYVVCFPRYLINNPIDPEHLCEAFRREIASIDDSVAIKKMLYKAFQNTLMDHLPALYKVFESLLVEHGAPSDVAHDIVWKKNYPTASKPDATAETFSPGAPLPSFDNAAYHYSEPGHYQDSLSPNSQHRAKRPAHAQPVTQTAAKLFNLLNQGLAYPPTNLEIPGQQAHYTLPDEPIAPVYSPDDLLAALSKLQASRASQQKPQNAASLLQHQLEKSDIGPVDFGSKSFSTEDRTKLEVYDQLFQALLGELALSPNIKSYLETIKIPLMALSLQDPTFLDSDNHPARHLLNQLFSLDSAVTQNKVVKNTQIRKVLDQLMDKVAEGSIADPDMFVEANEELKEISAPIVKSKEANIRRVIEVYQGKEKLEKARQKIQHAIDNRLSGKTIPTVIQHLLDSGWQHLLVIAELNEDTENRLRYFESVDLLLNWYANLDDILQEHTGLIETELEFIGQTLDTVSTNAFFHNKVMQEIRENLLGVGAPPVKSPVKTALVELKPEAIDEESIPERWDIEIGQFETGYWFTFSLEKEAFEPLKLIWIGETPQVFVFVNRDGYKKQELTRKELADLLESGAVAQIENLDEPVMDRATTTMLQHMQEKLIHSVSHDTVTDLPNRKRFISLLKKELTDRNSNRHVLGYLEIEDFRIITNVCGLAGGDQLLLQVANLIKRELDKGHLVSRLGDKTFGFLLPDTSADEGEKISKYIRDLINKTSFVWNDKSYTISVSIGLVPILENSYPNVEELLRKADSANISATRAGHNRIRVFQENDESLRMQTDIHEWAGRIDRIFADNRLFARCQMIAPIEPEKNSHSHYEILLGVRDDDGKILPPDIIIPAIERYQRMPEIDRWIVENVFAWIVDNRRCFDRIGGFAINLSGQSLNSEEFLGFLKGRLSVQDVPPEKITFEVTETVAAGSLVFTKRFIKEIKQFGCKFSLDDFGTGYSSYSYLKSLEVDYLKIDGSFIKDIANSPTDMVMVNSMNEIAHSLELETIAEYVENMTVHTILKEIGVDYAQGWGIHKPMPLADLARTLNS